MASVSRDRSQNNLHQQFEGVDIDWTVIEKKLLMWGDLFRNKGKKLRLDICIDYLADGSEPTTSRPGDKQGTTSVTKTMLSKRDAQIDAEHSSGQPSPWRNVYKSMHCPGSPCQNKDGYCWQDPVRKKHYYLKMHHLKCLVELVKKKKLDLEAQDNIPDEIRTQLYAENQQWLEGQRKATKCPQTESGCPPININFLPTQSQPSMMATPACSPPLLSQSSPSSVDIIMIPDLPLDVAVREYSTWHQSRVDSQMLKDNIEKARGVAITNGLNLKQIANDEDPDFIKHGVIVGVARRFVDDICEWSGNWEPAV